MFTSEIKNKNAEEKVENNSELPFSILFQSCQNMSINDDYNTRPPKEMLTGLEWEAY